MKHRRCREALISVPETPESLIPGASAFRVVRSKDMRALACAAVSALILPVIVISLQSQGTNPRVQEYPVPLVRERQVVVNGAVTETWELRWKAPPTPACEPSDISLTCPCTGFAYGEGGDLSLGRIRDGREIDNLELTPFFEREDVNLKKIAILQRWKPNHQTDFDEALNNHHFRTIVARRPVVKIMDFIDYDHDGNRSEFYLQTDTLPCGKSVGVVVGVSPSNPKLHVFGTASRPTEHLVLQQSIWEALGRASRPLEVEDWPCGDHGSHEGTTVRLHWTVHGIDGVRRTFTCPTYPGQRPITEERL